MVGQNSNEQGRTPVKRMCQSGNPFSVGSSLRFSFKVTFSPVKLAKLRMQFFFFLNRPFLSKCHWVSMKSSFWARDPVTQGVLLAAGLRLASDKLSNASVKCSLQPFHLSHPSAPQSRVWNPPGSWISHLSLFFFFFFTLTQHYILLRETEFRLPLTVLILSSNWLISFSFNSYFLFQYRCCQLFPFVSIKIYEQLPSFVGQTPFIFKPSNMILVFFSVSKCELGCWNINVSFDCPLILGSQLQQADCFLRQTPVGSGQQGCWTHRRALLSWIGILESPCSRVYLTLSFCKSFFFSDVSPHPWRDVSFTSLGKC